MSTMRQVLHVARKDLRYAKWVLVIYGAGLGYMVYQSLAPFERGAVWPIFLMLPMLAAIVSMLVHGDSPARPDAFWATRPLSPLAVAAAKLLAIGVGIGIPSVIAQWVVLTTFGLQGAALFDALVRSAFALIVIVGLVFALTCVTRTTGEFVVLLITLLFANQLTVGMKQQAGIAAPWIVESTLSLLPPLLCVLVVYVMYRTRQLPLGRRIGAGAFASMIASSFVSDGALPPWSAAPAVQSGSAHQYMRGDSLVIDAAIPSHPGDSATRMTGTITRIDVGSRRGHLAKGSLIWSRPVLIPGDVNLQWLDRVARFDAVPVSVVVPAQDAHAVVPEAIRIEGFYGTERQEILGSVPLVAGQSIKADGYLMKIVSVDFDARTVDLRAASIAAGEPRSQLSDREAFEYVAVNPIRKEAIRLRTQSGFGNPLPLPVAGLPSSNGRHTLAALGEGLLPAGSLPNGEWYRDAVLVVIRWRPAGKVPFSLRVPASAVTGHGTLPR